MNAIKTFLSSSSLKILLISLTFTGVAFFYNVAYQPWLYLSLLGLALSTTILFEQKITIPSSKTLILFFTAFLLLIVTSLLNGANLLEERWIWRYIVIVLSLLSLQFIKNERDLYQYLKLPLSFFIFAICTESLLQFFLLYDQYSTASLSTYSSRFYNINIFAQALIASLPFIFLFRKYSLTKWAKFYDFLILLIFICIWLSACRSTWIALVLFFGLELIKPLVFNRKKIIFLFFTSLIMTWSFKTLKNINITPTLIGKEKSQNARAVLIQKTIQLARDNPTGVGENKFMFSIMGYFDENHWTDNIVDITASPHSEPLRILAENGLGIFILSILILGYFYLSGLKKIFHTEKETFFIRYMFCLIPEILFQFPTEMFMPNILFCFSIATYLNKESIEVNFSKLSKLSIIATTVLIIFSFTIRNIYLIPKEYSPTFCKVFQDDWLMCRRYFSEFYVQGDIKKADEIVKPQLKWQPFNFYFLALDYSLGIEPKSSVAACLYYNIFNGEKKIDGSDVSKCPVEKDRSKIISAILEYGAKR